MAKYAVIIPVFGEDHFTRAILQQLELETDLVDIYVIDNKDDFEYSTKSHIIILRPGENLRWTRGTNLGWFEAARNDYDGYILMNNDVVLSDNFCAELIKSQQFVNAGIIAPCYDDVWPQQKNGYYGPAKDYQLRPHIKKVKFVDGTCMLVSRECFEQVGFLDDYYFGEYGWGGDFDYAIRAQSRGFSVYVTERCYLNHVKQGTVQKNFLNWESDAGSEMNTGMEAKYGRDWKKVLLGL